MILQSLRDLAESEQLVDDPAFESKAVRWIVSLDTNGQFRQLYDTNTPEPLPEGSKKKPKMQAKLMLIPRRQGRSSGIRSDFLVDNAKYALRLAADAEDAADPRIAQCHAAFADLLRSAGDGIPEVSAVLSFLAAPAEKDACRQKLEDEGGFASNDLFAFEVEGVRLTELDALKAWWGQRHHASSEQGDPAQCLVCGELRVPARLHNSFQVRGASTSGVPLVSFNAGAFESYGLSGNENAPVCTACMTSYTEALRRLTRPQYEAPGNRKLRPQSTVLNADTTAVYWAEGQSALPSILSNFLSNPLSIRDLLFSPRKGEERILLDPSRFYCLIVTGVQGRVSIRRLHTSTVAEVAENLRHYFRNINVARYNMQEPLPLYRLMQSMVLQGERDRLPADLGAELWLYALFGGPLSRNFLATVVGRNRAERTVPAERAALLHLYFASQKRPQLTNENANQGEETDAPMSLDCNTTDQPYLLGRLLAILESLQTAAQGQGLNRTLVDRTFGAASTRPGVVFPQLIQTAQHHMNKASRNNKGRAIHLDKLLGQITDGVNAEGFPSVLDLQQQGRFALGYYHQRQDFYKKQSTDNTPSSGEVATAEETYA